MEGLTVHHIGYAVPNIEKAKAVFEQMGFAAGDIVADDIRNVKIVFLKKDATVIELVASNGEGNPVDGVLKKNGPTPYHICYEVDLLEDAIAGFKALRQGWIVLKQPEIAPAIAGRRVAFLFQKDIGMIELVEMR